MLEVKSLRPSRYQISACLQENQAFQVTEEDLRQQIDSLQASLHTAHNHTATAEDPEDLHAKAETPTRSRRSSPGNAPGSQILVLHAGRDSSGQIPDDQGTYDQRQRHRKSDRKMPVLHNIRYGDGNSIGTGSNGVLYDDNDDVDHDRKSVMAKQSLDFENYAVETPRPQSEEQMHRAHGHHLQPAGSLSAALTAKESRIQQLREALSACQHEKAELAQKLAAIHSGPSGLAATTWAATLQSKADEAWAAARSAQDRMAALQAETDNIKVGQLLRAFM